MEIMLLAENMELVRTNGMMDHNIQVIGMKIKSVELVFIHGLMVVIMKESGKIITWKA